MIKNLLQLVPAPKIFVISPPKIVPPGNYDIDPAVVNDILDKLIGEIAEVAGVTLIDVFSATLSSTIVPFTCDNCHPVPAAYELIANVIAPYISNAGEEILSADFIASNMDQLQM